MATKTHLLIFFSFALMALSIADATIIPSGRITVIVNGTLFCTINGAPGVNGSATPVFANATVQVRCLGNNIVASTTTNSTGVFTIIFIPSPVDTVRLLGNLCQLRVTTPLVACNATLPSDRRLASPLRLIGIARNATTTILTFGPTGFRLVAGN